MDDCLVLGINSVYHETSACVLRNGRLVSIMEEERLSRVKRGKRGTIDSVDQLPHLSIRWCLDQAGVDWRDLTAIASSFDPRLRVPAREYGVEPGRWGSPEGERAFVERVYRIPLVLSEMAGFDVAERFMTVPHELAHAASAFYPSGMEEAAIISLDGIGESTTGLLAHGQGGDIRCLRSFDYPDSLGLLWEKMSRFLGMDQYAPPKLMALAAFGHPGRYESGFRELVKVGEDGGFTVANEIARFRTRDMRGLEELFYERPQGSRIDHRDADLSADLQRLTEEILFRLADHLADVTGAANLCFAGGVALNCVALGRLAARGRFERYFVQPAANDAGTALGAALWATRCLRGPLPSWPSPMSPYAGLEYSDEEIVEALDGAGMCHRRPSDLDGEVVSMLTAGRVGGWFQGRMELGPRALGNRSIVADPRRATARELINLRAKHREYFRPFAPAVLREHAGDWFEIAGDSPSWAFMSFACPIRADKEPLVPAVAHVDGTARVQVVDAAVNPRFHHLVEAFRARTGVPLLLNTSFNGPEQPIVASPADAIGLFQRSGLDFLAIGDRLVVREDAKRVDGSIR
jgi:carbamoyltransferase